MNIKNRQQVGWLALVTALFLGGSSWAEETQFDLAAMGGCAVSPDQVTLVVSLTAKTELVYIDTVAGKEAKRVSLEFQPTYMVWGEKVLFVAQKGSGLVHILDADTGKELASGKAEGPVRSMVMVKGICFVACTNNKVFAISAKGETTKTEGEGSFVAADPKGDFIYTCAEGKATTDVYKYAVKETKLTKEKDFFRSLRASLINVQGFQVTADGKSFGVVAGAGWTDDEKKRHYGIPLYDAEDMKSQLGELETGAFPAAFIVHPDQPFLFGCTGKAGSVFKAKGYTSVQKINAPKETAGATPPSVLAFVAKGKKLAWGTTSGDSGVLKLYDIQFPDK